MEDAIEEDPEEDPKEDQSVTIDFPCDFLGISMLEQPNKYYFIICGHKIVLEVDSSILLIMEKLQSYNSKVALHFKDNSISRTSNSKGYTSGYCCRNYGGYSGSIFR
ncbi:hypothetical protein JHK87_031372 [Glycine soja]|nr:hypothetical protein JHK87_031372 [Glycine soja]